MKVYTFGQKEKPSIMLFPGTCCNWKSNFQAVIPLLEQNFYVMCVSYDGFDETEHTEFSTMLDEVKKIEKYIHKNCSGHIYASYGCSLGGSFVGLLTSRKKIQMNYGIIGSSDLDQASPFVAKIMTNTVLPFLYPMIHDGQFRLKILRKMFAKQRQKMPEYTDAFLKMFSGARPYVTMQSCKNQFYSDMITPLPNDINTDTSIHIFYALKMGTKYRKRYLKHFVNPVIHEQNMQHEEFLVCYPEEWTSLVTKICLNK